MAAPSLTDLERQLKAAVRTGKVTVGRKEVGNSLKGSKLLVWSASANLPLELLKQSESLGIPSIRYDGNPIELGHVAGIPFKVSVLSVKTAGDAKLDAFSESRDYSPTANRSFSSPTLTGQSTASSASPVEEIVTREVQKAQTPKTKGKKETSEPRVKGKKASPEVEEVKQGEEKKATKPKTKARTGKSSEEREEREEQEQSGKSPPSKKTTKEAGKKSKTAEDKKKRSTRKASEKKTKKREEEESED